MDGKIKFLSENKKKGTKKVFEIKFSKKDFLLVLVFPSLVSLLSNDNFLEFVVKIIKIIMNRPFYYCSNNRFFLFMEVYNGHRCFNKKQNYGF